MGNLIRLVACGSVDDGKSTLIGRLLYNCGALSEDQLLELSPSASDPPDFSLALDGLEAEREQGITIDVAHRSFSTSERRFLIADVPGHEQYTRNMITGASSADAALLVLDATNGIAQQTRRHVYLASLFGIRHFILAVNKLDLIEFDEKVFRRLSDELSDLLARLGPIESHVIPISARLGDNVSTHSSRMPWYKGLTLLEALNKISNDKASATDCFRFPVQLVNRSVEGRRAYCGLVSAGDIELGEMIKIQPSGQEARVTEIITFDGSLARAVAGQSLGLVIDKPLDVGRGSLVCKNQGAAECADVLHATVIWMGDMPLARMRSYRLKIGTQTVLAQIEKVESKLDIDTFASLQTDTLAINEIGFCSVLLDEPVAFDPYKRNRDTGAFVLIDRVSNDTIGAGLIHTGELKAGDTPWQKVEVNKSSRTVLNKHPPAVIWFTGISGAGKSTIANIVEKMLHAEGCHTYLLDGDNLRHGLTRDLGFSDADRVENVRRVAEVAKLMVDAGLIVLVALISPFRAERRAARTMVDQGEFIEVFVDTPLTVAEARDVKGLYRKARLGQVEDFTGITSTYEAPEHPELHIDTTKVTAQEASRTILAFIERTLRSA